MASSLIHLAVASEVNKKLNYDHNLILIGSIAPDMPKEIGEGKLKNHFLDSIDNDIPNVDKFLKKYKKNLNNSFVMGYFIHLFTDYLWFKYFLTEFYTEPMITKLDGNVIKCNGDMLFQYIYNDYTNLNIKLIKEYNLDLSFLDKELPFIEDIIEELPIERIDVIIKKVNNTISTSKERKALIFNLKNIKKFIEFSVELILAEIEELDISK